MVAISTETTYSYLLSNMLAKGHHTPVCKSEFDECPIQAYFSAVSPVAAFLFKDCHMKVINTTTMEEMFNLNDVTSGMSLFTEN